MKYAGHGRETMNLFHKKAADNRGFTLIEVIAVLIILGIISAVAITRAISTQEDLISQVEVVKSHLRYAQLKALQDDTATWGIAFAANSYTLTTTAAGGAGLLPAENSSTHTFPSGVTVTNPQTVTFNPWGSPGTANIPITLSQGGSTLTLTVTGNTGFITP
jgi:prepilin-type N-terminal cleavage/methylation domain-containing protein